MRRVSESCRYMVAVVATACSFALAGIIPLSLTRGTSLSAVPQVVQSTIAVGPTLPLSRTLSDRADVTQPWIDALSDSVDGEAILRFTEGDPGHFVEHVQLKPPKVIPRKVAPKVTSATGVLLSPPVSGPITSRFGMRVHPITGVYKLHTGTDFGVPLGVPVGAAAAGTVLSAGWGGAYGIRVVIDHGVLSGHHVITTYNHLSSLAVRGGDRVSVHQGIGRVGSTGYSTGAHLHFEVIADGQFTDPMPWLDGRAVVVDLSGPEYSVGGLTPAPTPSPTPSTSATPTPTPTPSATPTTSATPISSVTPRPSAAPTDHSSAIPSSSEAPSSSGTPSPPAGVTTPSPEPTSPAPEPSAPEPSAPEPSAPEPSAPDTSAPDTSAPPATTAPESSAPESSTPAASSPATSAPAPTASVPVTSFSPEPSA